ncbi:beta-lactamase hydrolase domain-containing protein [Luteitalea sp.]
MDGVVNFSRVDAAVACGGDTQHDVFPTLAAQGFTTVVNLRLPDEPGVAEEAAAVADAGLRYFHLPMNPAAPLPETAEAFLDVLADPANQPVYIHCASANRVGAVWAIKRVVQDAWSREDALAEARHIGLKSPVMLEFVARVLDARG